jgi:hypothetical protein
MRFSTFLIGNLNSEQILSGWPGITHIMLMWSECGGFLHGSWVREQMTDEGVPDWVNDDRMIYGRGQSEVAETMR